MNAARTITSQQIATAQRLMANADAKSIELALLPSGEALFTLAPGNFFYRDHVSHKVTWYGVLKIRGKVSFQHWVNKRSDLFSMKKRAANIGHSHILETTTIERIN